MMGLFEKATKRKKPPVIMTEYGPVSERARVQAAANMRDSVETRKRVEAILVKQYGEELGLQEARRRYPEAYEEPS
jgi:DNA polymerase IIIc chi subunit